MSAPTLTPEQFAHIAIAVGIEAAINAIAPMLARFAPGPSARAWSKPMLEQITSDATAAAMKAIDHLLHPPTAIDARGAAPVATITEGPDRGDPTL